MMMMNSSGSNEERIHRNPISGNSTPSPSASSGMKHQGGIAMKWTPQELAILENALISYRSEPNVVLRYAKIALELENKTVRDVAMRCRWKNKKETNKRRKEDHYGSGRFSVDNKEIIDMVVASNSSAPYQIAQSSLLSEEHGITNELIEENKQMFNQICENFASLKLRENVTFFSKIGENIRKLLKDINENLPETMKHMPELKDDLVDAIFLSSNVP